MNITLHGKLIRWIPLALILFIQSIGISDDQPATPKLVWTADGFSIQTDTIRTSNAFEAVPFGLIGYPQVKPIRMEQSMVYQYEGWTAKVSPKEDETRVHFEIEFTNTSNNEAELPDFNLCTLSGNTEESMWGSNIAAPLVLNQKLAGGTQFAITIDDPYSPMIAISMHITQPANGDNVIRFSTNGGELSKKYNVPTSPTRVAAGASSIFRCSLRFGPDLKSVSREVNELWAKAFPYALKWNDRRQMLRGDLFQYDSSPANPQGFMGRYDINDPANARHFENYVMRYARQAIANCKAVNAGTWIEWDLEGKQLEMNYKGNPTLIEELNSGWSRVDESGVKLIDRFFKMFQDAGIHVGVCLRPWTLRLKDGKLEVDETVSGVDSIRNQIDYCYKRWGVDVFYYDSPEFYHVHAYRKMMLERPHVLLIPEDVPETWLAFSAPMVWEKDNIINWVSVPRNIYGDQGWGVYYKQDLSKPEAADRFLFDAKRGSTAIHDGWMGIRESSLRAATRIISELSKPPSTQPNQ